MVGWMDRKKEQIKIDGQKKIDGWTDIKQLETKMDGWMDGYKKIDICCKQIYVRKQISIRCNRIEYWVHLRCAGIRQTQYTGTWTCHLHR